jgi:hypothetical protein
MLKDTMDKQTVCRKNPPIILILLKAAFLMHEQTALDMLRPCTSGGGSDASMLQTGDGGSVQQRRGGWVSPPSGGLKKAPNQFEIAGVFAVCLHSFF